ncbi:hypothetical protein CCACVL1_01657 [Corchorus capsularis]|uniref:Uncharacterized protein n=1 Tax=Corchorus capsularis TaxID=210143 RepID=A0A1R3KGN8_COCAP|nr:hypothetical protein CCACVL1_01657 [Corchorus capsularis]
MAAVIAGNGGSQPSKCESNSPTLNETKLVVN